MCLVIYLDLVRNHLLNHHPFIRYWYYRINVSIIEILNILYVHLTLGRIMLHIQLQTVDKRNHLNRTESNLYNKFQNTIYIFHYNR